jgi:hypothetical protein
LYEADRFGEAVGHERARADDGVDEARLDHAHDDGRHLRDRHRAREGRDDEAVRVLRHGGEHVGGLAQRAAAECGLRHGAYEVVARADGEGIERGEGLEVILEAVGEVADGACAAVRMARVGHGGGL